jgi:site-specific recombinase XerD
MMGRPRKTFTQDVHEFVDYIKIEEDYKERTIRYYRDEGACIFSLLDGHVREGIRAKDVTKEDVFMVVDYMRRNNYAVQTMKGYICALRRICMYHDNPVPLATKIRWPQDMRPSVDWLTQDEAQKLIDCPKTPMQEMVIHLELCMGLRRIEVARLRLSDIDLKRKYVTVTGKADKLRLVPFHPDTGTVLSHYMAFRNALVKVAVSKDPMTEVPDNLIIWGKGRELSAYSQKKLTGFDKQIKALVPQVGIKFSNHTLRRTFGRTMYRCGVPLATIAKLLGHESTDVTLDYIGVDLDDMGSAMSQYVLRSSAVAELLEEQRCV